MNERANGKAGVYYYFTYEDEEEKYDSRGFDASGIHSITKTEYDPNGFDVSGRHKDTQWVTDQYDINCRGFNVLSYINVFTGTPYDPSGYDIFGIDPHGYDKNGLNKFGLDRKGCRESGTVDSDVSFALGFLESGLSTIREYARENEISEKNAREKLKKAREKCPDIDRRMDNHLSTEKRHLRAKINQLCCDVIDGSQSLKEFWGRHWQLTVMPLVRYFIIGERNKIAFSDLVIESIILDYEHIEDAIRCFARSKYDIHTASRELCRFKGFYETLTSGCADKQQLEKIKANIKKLRSIAWYFRNCANRNSRSLCQCRVTCKSGREIVIDKELVDEVKTALYNANKFACNQTVTEYIVANY